MADFLPHGTTVSIDGTSIGGLISVGIPEGTRGAAEYTDTGDSATRRFMAGLRDNGSFPISYRYDPDDAGQQALRTNWEANGTSATEEVIVTLPAAATTASGSKTFTFDAFVETPPSGELDLVADEVAVQSCSMKVDGDVTES